MLAAKPTGRLVCVTAMILMAGCAQIAEPDKVGTYRIETANLAYEEPDARDTSPVWVKGATAVEAARAVAADLRQAGVRDVSVDEDLAVVSGSSRSAQFIDCGIIDTGEGPDSRIPGTTAKSAIAVPDAQPTGFVWRLFDSSTRFVIAIQPSGSGFAAHISENHQARLTVRSTDKDFVRQRETIEFTEAQGGEFTSGLSCVSSGLVRRLIK